MFKKRTMLIFGIMPITWLVAFLPRLLVRFSIIDAVSLDSWGAMAFLLPNVLLAFGSVALLLSYRRLMQTLHLVFDLVCVLFFGAAYTIMTMTPGDFSLLLQFDVHSMLSMILVICDFLAFLSVILLITTIPASVKSNLVKFLAAGIILFVAADILQSAKIYQYDDVAQFAAQLMYGLSFLIMTAGGLSNPGQRQTGQLKNSDKSIIIALLLTAAIVLFFIDWNITFSQGMLIIGIGLVAQIVKSFILVTIKKKEMLKLQQELNLQLEKKVAERTEQLLTTNQQLERISRQDIITGLSNRNYFGIECDRMLQQANSDEQVALFFIDLDRFKGINDTHGHDVGDEVLIEVAARLRKLKRENTIQGRLGGDEFVMAIRGRLQLSKIDDLARELIKTIHLPIIIGPFQFHVTMSIGIAVYPTDAADRSMLMKNADIAMYHAKEQGADQYVFYNQQQKDKALFKSKLELLLRQADFDREFQLYYQPQFSLPDCRLIGAEALLRWHHPTEGLIMPNDFIPIAEESGLIVPLGIWVIRQAMLQALEWNGRQDRNLKLAVNLSSRQLDSIDFMQSVRQLLFENPVQPEWFDFEITESIALKEDERIPEILNEIAGLDISISIDDFGTGYSSLNYLKQYPIDRIKIARSLVENIADNQHSASILKAIIMMARALNLRVIAEGVEKEAQLQVLCELGCDEVQGYLTGRPVPAADFELNFFSSSVKAEADIHCMNSVRESAD